MLYGSQNMWHLFNDRYLLIVCFTLVTTIEKWTTSILQWVWMEWIDDPIFSQVSRVSTSNDILNTPLYWNFQVRKENNCFSLLLVIMLLFRAIPTMLMWMQSRDRPRSLCDRKKWVKPLGLGRILLTSQSDAEKNSLEYWDMQKTLPNQHA